MARTPRKPVHMQPIVKASDGVIRFQANRLVEHFVNMASEGKKFDLNDAAILAHQEGISRAEQMQLAQLIGYSVSGFGDLSYADRDTIRRADRKAAALTKKRK